MCDKAPDLETAAQRSGEAVGAGPLGSAGQVCPPFHLLLLYYSRA